MQTTVSRPLTLEGFDEFVTSAMADWNVPGLGVLVVKDGDVLLAEGYGSRNIETGLEVTPRTLFAIGSCTKAFTATALAMMVDEGKLDWDMPVREYLPDFRLHDEVATAGTTAFDLLTHRTGMARHEFMWYNSPLSRREIFARLRHLEPNMGFRQVFQYSNLMYMAAGILLEKLSGMRYEDFIRERIFRPLGMTSSNLGIEEAQAATDVAHPYEEKDGKVKPMEFRNIDAIGPAGSINSSVVDMAPWLLLQLNHGKHGDVQLLSEAQMARIHAPHIVMEGAADPPEMPFSCYGLGWGVRPYRGHVTLQHAGGIDGFIAVVGFVPSHNIGVVVLSNRDSNLLPSVVTLSVFDRLIGLEPVAWNERILETVTKMKEAAAQAAGETEQTAGAPASHELGAYAGDFEHPGYGTLRIVVSGEDLEVTHNGLTWPLRHAVYDMFEWDFVRFGAKFKATFRTNASGEIDAVEVPLETTVSGIIFKRTVTEA